MNIGARTKNARQTAGMLDGERWSRTIEDRRPTDLQSAAFDHFATSPCKKARLRGQFDALDLNQTGGKQYSLKPVLPTYWR